MRLAQWDILELCRNGDHRSPPFPEGSWPMGDGPPSESAWDHSIGQFREGLQALEQLIGDPAVNLLAPIRHGDGQTILREALLLADPNAYHVGQLIVVRRLLKAWELE